MIYLSVVYVNIIVLSNILSNQIVSIFGLTFDAGTLIFPIIFTLRDFIHLEDKKIARNIATLSLYLNIATALIIKGVLLLELAGKNNLVGISSTFNIVIASSIALYVSLKIDYIIFEKTKSIIKSNVVSVIFDTMIFCLLAFFELEAKMIFDIMLFNIVFKLALTVVQSLIARSWYK